MGLLDRVRSWLGGLLGADEAEQETTPEDEEPRLDPENVTEVRKRAEDDPAAKLEEVRTAQESGEGTTEDAGNGVAEEAGDGSG